MATPARLEPRPDQESVWDYPRPPLLQKSNRRVQVWLDGVLIADTSDAYRVLETYHPPTWYLPPGDIATTMLRPAEGSSFCEWKGAASYYDVVTDRHTAQRGAWTYFDPTPAFAELAAHVSFYPSMLDCRVDSQIVEPQAGGFYGGWVTTDVTGPFKGVPGMDGW